MKTLTEIYKALGPMEGFRDVSANCFIQFFENGFAVVSYLTPVYAFIKGEGYLLPRWDYSTTTSKHLNQATGRTASEYRKALAKGEITEITEF